MKVALVRASRTAEVNRTAQEPPFHSMEASRLAPTRPYGKLLKFSPVELPPPPFNEAEYQGLSALTTLPTAREDIRISYPNDANAAQLLIAALTLFIDEDGDVAKVRVEEPKPAESYQRAAVDAFSKAKFNPGMVGEHRVKTRMVIRVAFENGLS